MPPPTPGAHQYTPTIRTAEGTPVNITALSLGAGVQSTTLALLAVEGVLPKPDVAIFADTGWEPRAVYDHLDRLAAVLDDAGIPLHRVSNGNLRTDSINPTRRYVAAPYYVRNPDGSDGMGRRQCTSEYKLVPIRRKVRELLGADCERWLEDRGWATEKSACIGCPFHGNRAWRELRDTKPNEWADAVEFDRLIRKGGARGEPIRGEQYLHRSRVPLDQAPIDRVTRREWHDRQVDLLDLIAEEGDPDGCSPYGCRSGEEVA